MNVCNKQYSYFGLYLLQNLEIMISSYVFSIFSFGLCKIMNNLCNEHCVLPLVVLLLVLVACHWFLSCIVYYTSSFTLSKEID